MNVLFVNTNLFGHVNPTLPLMREMVARGNRVDCFCGDNVKDNVTASGAAFLPFPDTLRAFLRAYRPSGKHPYFTLIEYMLSYTQAMLPCALALCEKGGYDIVIGDSMFGGVPFLRRILDIPVVSSHAGYVTSKPPVPEGMLTPDSHPQLDACYALLARLSEKYATQAPSLSELFMGRAETNIAYTIPAFYGDGREDLKSFLFTGSGMQNTTVPDAEGLDDDKPLVYISLGSVNTDFADFYNLCMEALGGADMRVAMAVGAKCDVSRLGDIPANFTVGGFLPQLSLLKRAAAFITHAGFNSVNEAMYFGVPMLTLPMMNDQPMAAKRVGDMELGLVADIKVITAQDIADAVHRLLTDEGLRARCKDMAARFAAYKGLPTTASALEALANRA